MNQILPKKTIIIEFKNNLRISEKVAFFNYISSTKKKKNKKNPKTKQKNSRIQEWVATMRFETKHSILQYMIEIENRRVGGQ